MNQETAHETNLRYIPCPKMPRQDAPPTPASSTEIKGKEGSHSLQMTFELPPPAVTGVESRPTSASTKSASSYHPTTPKSPAPAIPASESVKIRRRASIAQPAAKDAFALPPPPTRSRKIIQMKPRGQPEQSIDAPAEGGQAVGKNTPTHAKKKQPSSTSVAGRKIARKTAHSLIERRRRSKMNEEFGVLKDMIPACTGEMHKLAILQASIDYVRYLEDCIAKLKAENKRNASTPVLEQFHLPPPMSRGAYESSQQQSAIEDDEDVEMDDSEAVSPTGSTPILSTRQPSISPAIPPQDSHCRQDSYSSTSYGYTTSATTSPNFGPISYEYARSNGSVIGSALTSPALQPQTERDLDQEATAALLMLNTDRRNTQGSLRGMSVKDLLSG